MIYGSTGLQPSSCPVSYRSFSLYLKTFLWCLYNMTEHHLTTTVLIVGHTLAEIPKWVPYPFKKSPFYPIYSHFTLPYILMVKAGLVQPWIEWYLLRSGCWVLVLAGCWWPAPVSSVSAVCIRRPHLAAPCHHHHTPAPAPATPIPAPATPIPAPFVLALLFKLTALFRVGARAVNNGRL